MTNLLPLTDLEPARVARALRVVGAALVADLARESGQGRDLVLAHAVAHAEAVAGGYGPRRYVDGVRHRLRVLDSATYARRLASDRGDDPGEVLDETETPGAVLAREEGPT